jgi:hypothetical protein
MKDLIFLGGNTGLLVQAAGCGSRLSLLSLIAPMVPDDTRARLYTAVSLVDTIGQLVGSPFMEFLLAQSLRLHDWAKGLPFIVSAV